MIVIGFIFLAFTYFASEGASCCPTINQLYQLMSVEKLQQNKTETEGNSCTHTELPQLIQFNANYPGQAQIRAANILARDVT